MTSRSDRTAYPTLGDLLKDDEDRSHRSALSKVIGPIGEPTPEQLKALREAIEQQSRRSKYHREIKPGVFIDVYDVLKAFDVRNPALQHLLKKALAAGQRGHKDLATDMDDIVASAIRARELAE